MQSLRLVEMDVFLIEQYLQANIDAALLEVSTDRGDNFVGLESPKSYFHFPMAAAYRAPAVFTIPEDFDFRLNTGPNSISALAQINVAVVCEDKDMHRLTTKVWRYQAALTKLLYLAQLQSSDNSVKIVTKVVKNTFSDIYPRARDENDPDTVFRKEVVVQLEVEHYEEVQSL